METAIKGDKQGLGMTKRNKKRFEAQQMVTQLNTLAHNTIVWARQWLTPYVPRCLFRKSLPSLFAGQGWRLQSFLNGC